MAKKDADEERFIPDLLNMKYEHLFRIIGRKGKFSLELKCLFLVLILYVPGLLTTFLGGNISTYVFGAWRHFVRCVLIGVCIWFIIRIAKRMNKKIQHVSQIISPTEREEGQEGYQEWMSWKERIDKCKKWMRRGEPYKWFYAQAVGGAVCGFIFSVFVIKPEVGWVNRYFLNEMYLRIWYISLGYLVGGCLHFLGTGFWAIRKYCKDVVSHKEILPLDPDQTGGLRELGRLSLDLDLFVAIPSIAFPLYLFQNPELPLLIDNIGPWIIISLLYAFFLVFVFFVSISPIHDDMVTAKTNYLLKIHSEYKDMHKMLLHRLDTEQRIEPEEYNRLSNLYKLYDRVEGMAVWPLDFHTTLRFSLTSLLPLISVGITISFTV